MTHPMSESLLRRRLVIAPLLIGVMVYCVVVIGDDYRLQVEATPVLIWGLRVARWRRGCSLEARGGTRSASRALRASERSSRCSS